MTEAIQAKIDAIKKLAQSADAQYYIKSKKSSSTQNSLAKVIKTQKQADEFLADLETAISLAKRPNSDQYDNSEWISTSSQDSLSKVIKTRKQADEFLADLETAIKLAKKQ